MKTRYLAGAAILAAAALALTGCAGGATPVSNNAKTLTLAQAQKATSVADFGGMAGLVAAANKEGHLNVITLPPTWAN